MSDLQSMLLQSDPSASYRAHRAEIDAAIARVLASNRYILGPEVVAFEGEFADWLGAEHVVSCANGTDALVLSLRAAGVGPGDPVLTVSHTAVATVAAIEIVGAKPILLDIDAETYTMAVDELAEALERPPGGAPIKAIVPVHIYGQASAMPQINALAERWGVPVIEDCAQSPGAAVDGLPTGRWGAAASFSFYPTKNLGAVGDGGAVVTKDPAMAERLRALRQYGWDQDRISRVPGMNSRLDEMQAAILRIKLKTLSGENARRRAVAAAYDAALSRGSATRPYCAPGREHVFHQYVIRTHARDEAQRRFTAAGIGTAIHYPVPVHRQSAYLGRTLLGPAACRTTEAVAGEILSLPMHAFLEAGDVEKVCEVLRTL